MLILIKIKSKPFPYTNELMYTVLTSYTHPAFNKTSMEFYEET